MKKTFGFLKKKKKKLFSSTALFYLTDLSFIVTYSTLFKFVNKLMSNH